MPDISVVIPSVNGFGDLGDCLAALEALRDEVDLEAVVVDRLGEAVRAEVRRRFPWARTLEVAPGTPIPEMRAVGMGAATAPAIAVIEDHVLLRPGWARLMLTSLAEGADVVGGPIENAATDTVVDWASFLCEYSHCLPPLPRGEVDWLPGNNVVYSREVLDEQADVIAEHAWENRLHDAIREAGKPLVCNPDAVADHKKHFTVGSYMALRYQFSRSFAGTRVRGASVGRRALFALGALALPPVLFYRTVSRIRSKGRHTDRLTSSLPYIALFVIAWAFGELVGYVSGPGDSLGRVT